MKLNDEGDIGIHIAAEQPEGVPEENWLPLNRDDYGIDLLIWLYLPDLDKFKTWNASKAEILTSPRAKQEKVKRPQSILAAPKSRTSYGARISTWPRRMSSTRTLFYTRKYRVADLVLAAAEQIESERKFVGR